MAVSWTTLILLVLFKTGDQFEIDHWGNHFVLTFLQNGDGDVQNSLVITTREDSNILVTAHEINQSEYVHLNAAESHIVSFNISTTAKPSLKVLPLKAVSIESSKAISVYGFTDSTDPTYRSKDGFLILPVPGLGVEYLAATCNVDGPQIAVAAVENNTKVNIQIRCNIEVQCYRGYNLVTYADNHVLTFNLNEHDAVNLYCLGETTGSIVNSNKPVAVISGCSCGHGTYMISCDHLVEMMPPTTEQGTHFVVATPTASLSMIRLISTNDLIVHNTAGLSHSFQTNSRFKSVMLHGSELCLISDKPMFVVLYYKSNIEYTNGNVGALMTVVPPQNKYTNNYTINAEATALNNSSTNVAITICKSGNCPTSLTNLKPMCQGRYSISKVLIDGIETWQNPDPFMIFIFARDSETCGGYPAGMKLTDYSGNSECSSNPCYHNGWCLESGITYRCRCWGSYGGDYCKEDMDVLIENRTVNGVTFYLQTVSTKKHRHIPNYSTLSPITVEKQKDKLDAGIGWRVTTSDTTLPASDTTTLLSKTTISFLDTTKPLSDTTKTISDTTKSLVDTTNQISDTTKTLSDITKPMSESLSDSTIPTSDPATPFSKPTIALSATTVPTSGIIEPITDTTVRLSDLTIPTSDKTNSTKSSGTTMSDIDLTKPTPRMPNMISNTCTTETTSNSILQTSDATVTKLPIPTLESTLKSDRNSPTTTARSDKTNYVTSPASTFINAISPVRRFLRLCGCPCGKSVKMVKTPKLITVEEVLKVTKEKLSRNKRKKNSAVNLYDSEINLGYSACCMLLFVILVIVITDICKLFTWCNERWRKKKVSTFQTI